MSYTELAERFKNFAQFECKESSKLYYYLSLKISEDEELLEICAEAPIEQPVPNLLFGSVHFLLLKGRSHPLKEYYPSLTVNPREIEDQTFYFFKDFCKNFRKDISSILKTKIVQTNEVRRCAYLYPVFSLIFNKVQKPLSLVEIGTSAGLQLLWDKYSYSYGTSERYGNEMSQVHITSEIKRNFTPLMLKKSPPVSSRIGLDLHINDLKNLENYLWLKSLIWPEHKERLTLFESAASNFKENQVDLIEGDGILLLKSVVESLPEDTVICIFHTHVANQLSKTIKYDLLNQIKEIGEKRDLFHLYNNIWDRSLHLDYFLDGKTYTKTIGETDGHGKWFEWGIEGL